MNAFQPGFDKSPGYRHADRLRTINRQVNKKLKNIKKETSKIRNLICCSYNQLKSILAMGC